MCGVRARRAVTPPVRASIDFVAMRTRAGAVTRAETRGASMRVTARHRARTSARRTTTRATVRDFFTERDARGIILYDGVCNLCNGAVNFAMEYDGDRSCGSVRFAALQSDAGRALLRNCGREETDISSIVFVEGPGPEESYVKSEAILRIAKRMRAPFPQLSALGSLVPRAVGDFVYDVVANNRYSILGKRDVCRLGDDENDDRFIR